MQSAYLGPPFVLSRASSSTQAIPQGVWRGPHGWQPSAWASRLCSAHDGCGPTMDLPESGKSAGGGQHGIARLSSSPAVEVRERRDCCPVPRDAWLVRWVMVDLLDRLTATWASRLGLSLRERPSKHYRCAFQFGPRARPSEHYRCALGFGPRVCPSKHHRCAFGLWTSGSSPGCWWTCSPTDWIGWG